MKFKALQENLRKVLRQRIQRRELTGLKLAHQTGFQQAHISNFLNRKRALSLEGMDRVLQVQHLSVLDLLDAAEINQRATSLPPSEGDFENVVVVEGRVAAAQRTVTRGKVLGILKFKKSFLRRLRPSVAAAARKEWQRFVLVKADARQGMSMYPRLLPGSMLLLDRHYNTLRPYRRNEQNMYAVRKDSGIVVRYVELAGRSLVLRPHNPAYPVEILPIAAGHTAGDYLVGRVCQVSIET
jgi:transcriptional regulator with XRE-family HTH domain